MNKKVSVVIPTYKRSEFLQRAIDSVLSQTYSNIEIIVVDDNNPASEHRAETENKMQGYKAFDNILYIKNEANLGGALARNEGIMRASGDYITFLDDDDVYLPDKVCTQVEYMIDKELDLSFTDVRIHSMDDRLVDYREHYNIKDLSNKELLKQHIMHHLTPTDTYMFRREALLSIGGFEDVKMGQEFMLMLKAIENGLSIGYIPVANVIQYIHAGERISVGQNKVDKEIEMYNFKKNYFGYLSFRQKQYVKFRHHAVMAVVGKRSGKPGLSFKHLILAIATSPLDCIVELASHFRRIRKHRIIDGYRMNG